MSAPTPFPSRLPSIWSPQEFVDRVAGVLGRNALCANGQSGTAGDGAGTAGYSLAAYEAGCWKDGGRCLPNPASTNSSLAVSHSAAIVSTPIPPTAAVEAEAARLEALRVKGVV